ncbi:DUF4124 domain-containing protein [Pseudomarimonas salicorniae]|uniref:DUF4124 domain-containing protein n=1 Tax=Pseudomarimonas salicorniae TaxID=2933270 RepID=A0ABT0GHU3_9GAMM|nr:DUF4124 domain-containing protein [Lysobacter sp. CAU 1642]MCK7593912.1 DUF4124 domain-containing protein [Lysobacter sp. CAU 1642]
MRPIVIVLSCLLALPAAAGEIYKWTDEKGRTHYSDRPPPAQVESERRAIPAEPAPAVDGDAAASGEAAAQDSPPAVASNPDAEACNQARLTLRRLERDVAVRMDLDGDGVEESLDAEARLQQIQLTRDLLEARCSGDAS